MVAALAHEISMRKGEFEQEVVETIYFGGGTPSQLQITDLAFLIDTVYQNYSVSDHPEITLEANPDDLDDAIDESGAQCCASKKMFRNGHTLF